MKNPDLKKLKKSIKKMNPILKEFRDFINRGNVIDLAVGVIIGGAFNKIISSLVNDLIMPVVGIILGGIDFTNLEITIPNFLGGSSAAPSLWKLHPKCRRFPHRCLLCLYLHSHY